MEDQMKTMNKGGAMPDMSELMSGIFGGNEPKRAVKSKKEVKSKKN